MPRIRPRGWEWGGNASPSLPARFALHSPAHPLRALLVVALTVLFVFLAPSAAHATAYCDTNGWQTTSWGRGCDVDGIGQSDDIATDGYCVDIRYLWSNAWHYVSGTRSCGAITNPVAVDTPDGNPAKWVRLWRVTSAGAIEGSWLTLRCNGVPGPC